MTKEQAINILELYSGNRFGIISEDFWNAVNLALDSLKLTDNDEPDWSKAPEWANYYGIDGDG